jgi:hypothetical protein
MAAMNQSPEEKEGKIVKEVVLYLLYSNNPETKGKFLFEYRAETGLFIPERKIEEGETPLVVLDKEMRRRGIKPISIFVAQNFIESDFTTGENINYYPFLILEWEGKIGNKKSKETIPVWIDQGTAGPKGAGELGADKFQKLFILAWEKGKETDVERLVRATEELKAG